MPSLAALASWLSRGVPAAECRSERGPVAIGFGTLRKLPHQVIRMRLRVLRPRGQADHLRDQHFVGDQRAIGIGVEVQRPRLHYAGAVGDRVGGGDQTGFLGSQLAGIEEEVEAGQPGHEQENAEHQRLSALPAQAATGNREIRLAPCRHDALLGILGAVGIGGQALCLLLVIGLGGGGAGSLHGGLAGLAADFIGDGRHLAAYGLPEELVDADGSDRNQRDDDDVLGHTLAATAVCVMDRHGWHSLEMIRPEAAGQNGWLDG